MLDILNTNIINIFKYINIFGYPQYFGSDRVWFRFSKYQNFKSTQIFNKFWFGFVTTFSDRIQVFWPAIASLVFLCTQR